MVSPHRRFGPFRTALAALLVAALAVAPAPLRAAGIFIPQPRGSGETLDEGEDVSAEGLRGDLVITRDGDRLNGRVTHIDQYGKLHLRTPYFDGEAALLLSAIRRVTFTPKTVRGGRDRLVLANGDVISGEMVSISDANIVIESGTSGFLRIPRKTIRSISSGTHAEVLLESDFAFGDMSPWETGLGTWRVSQGTLVTGGQNGTPHVIGARLDQDDALTAEVRLGATNNLSMGITLFADGMQNNGTGANSVTVSVQNNRVTASRVQNGGQRQVGSSQFSWQRGRPLTCSVAYDPDEGKLKVWIDAAHVGDFVVPNPPKSGSYVNVYAHYTLALDDVKIWKGIVEPSADHPEADTKRDMVILANGDRMAVDSLKLVDNKLTVKTALGEIAYGLDKIDSILFHTEGIEPPPADDSDMIVRASGCNMSLKIQSMTKDHLIGVSAIFGQIKLNRGAIREIAYRAPE